MTSDLILEQTATLPPHPDVADGVRALTLAGREVITLSNGSPDLATKLLLVNMLRNVRLRPRRATKHRRGE